MWEERNDNLILPFFGIQFYSSLIWGCERIRRSLAE